MNNERKKEIMEHTITFCIFSEGNYLEVENEDEDEIDIEVEHGMACRGEITIESEYDLDELEPADIFDMVRAKLHKSNLSNDLHYGQLFISY